MSFEAGQKSVLVEHDEALLPLFDQAAALLLEVAAQVPPGQDGLSQLILADQVATQSAHVLEPDKVGRLPCALHKRVKSV